MGKYVTLSYNLSKSTPLYPGTPPLRIKRAKAISEGDTCNTFVLELSNHSGTHVDAPAHFTDSGKKISEYAMDELVFRKPVIVDCPKGPEGIIEIDDLSDLTHSGTPDSLLIRTGFHEYRERDVDIYRYKNPCLSPRAARWIRSDFPGIKAVGIDCVSIASFAHRQLGKETHEALLKEGGFKSAPVIIIEDLYIPREISVLDELIVLPIFMEDIDSAPCTVIGVRHD